MFQLDVIIDILFTAGGNGITQKKLCSHDLFKTYFMFTLKGYPNSYK